MDFKNLSVFNTANQNLRYLSAKQQVIAENIANVNTPGYLPKDIQKQKESFSSSLELATTNPMHLNSKGTTTTEFDVTVARPDSALTIDGNGVILEDQMNMASKASSEYNKTITIFNKYKTLLQVANTKIGS